MSGTPAGTRSSGLEAVRGHACVQCRQGLTASTTRPGCAGLAPCSQEGLQPVPVTGNMSPFSCPCTAKVVGCMYLLPVHCTALVTLFHSKQLPPLVSRSGAMQPRGLVSSPRQWQNERASALLLWPRCWLCPKCCLRRQGPQAAHTEGGHLQSADSMQPSIGLQPSRWQGARGLLHRASGRASQQSAQS